MSRLSYNSPVLMPTSGENPFGWARLGPVLGLGLYMGRVVAEFAHAGLLFAVLISFLAIAFSVALLFRLTPDRSWPALIFLLYVIYPEPDPRIAAMVALLALVSLIVVAGQYRLLSARPIANRQALSAILIAALFFSLYVSTLAQDVLPADSGEFQLAAAKLGIAHPPGFPLYTMIAHLATLVPISASAAYKVNLLSAVISATTLAFVFLTASKITNSNFGGLAATAVLGTSTTFWSQATTANIRSLTTFFLAVALFAFIKIMSVGDGEDQPGAVMTRADARGRRFVGFAGLRYPAILTLSLSLGISHHPSLAFIGLVLILTIVAIRRELIAGWRRKLGILFLAAVSLVPILYLPLRGASGAIGAPGDITTLPGLVNHVLALGFRGDLFYYVEPMQLWRRLIVMANVITFQFELWSLPFMIAGFLLLFARRRSLSVILMGGFVVHVLITATYRAPQTVEYMLPAYLPLSLFAGHTVGWLYERAVAAPSPAKRSALLGIVSAITIGLFSLAVFVQFEKRLPSMLILHRSEDTRAYAKNLIENAPRDAIILADWHWATPLRYLQEVDNQRPDIDIKFVFPTSEPYGQTWARRIKEEMTTNRDVIATHFDEFAYANLPPSEPLGDAFLYRQEPLRRVLDDYANLGEELGEALLLEGFSIELEEHRLDGEFVVNIAWRNLDSLDTTTKLFVHLVGVEGEIVAQHDLPAISQPSGITLTQFRLTPSAGTPPGVTELYAGASNDVPFLSPLGQPRIKLATIPLLPAEHPPYTENPVYRPLVDADREKVLIGYDWDFTQPARPRLYLHWRVAGGYWSQVIDRVNEYKVPIWRGPWGREIEGSKITAGSESHYVPFGQGIVWIGEPLESTALPAPGKMVKTESHFVASRPVVRDLITSVRLIGFNPGGETWDWWDLDDGVPAMGAIPTLKWIRDSYVRDPRWSTVAPTAEPGQDLAAVLRIYDSFTGRPLAILDKDIAVANPWVPMGTTTVGR